MAKYFGTVTATLGGTDIGEIVNFTPPDEEYDREDGTALDDTYPDTQIAPIPNASEREIVVHMDQSDTDQSTLEGYNGDNTDRALVITYPWANNNTYTQNVKVFNVSPGQITRKGLIQRTISIVTTGAHAWSTV